MAIVVLGYLASKVVAYLKTWGKMYTVWHISQMKDYLCFKSEKGKIFFQKRKYPMSKN